MAKGVKLKYPFDKMNVGDMLVGNKHIVGCAINWAKRKNNGFTFTSTKINDNVTQIKRTK